MSDNSNDPIFPTAAKVTLVIVVLAAAFILCGPMLVVWVALAVSAALYYLYVSWPYVLLVLATVSAFGAWTAQVNRRSLIRGAVNYAAYTFLAGSALYLAVAIYMIWGFRF